MDTPAVIGEVLLDKYRVERVLGSGGMGFVVAVRHVDLGQLYAMKFLLPAGLGHPEAVERFLREAQAAALLRSDHVARVHDVGRMADGAPYMIMEYLEGCDLKKYLERTGPLPVEEAVTFVLHACDAIAEAHAAGIIHRDLKPANLFLTKRRNGSLVVKVLDFGISKHTGAEKVELTNTTATLGSPLYMSPEQIAKSKTVDARTDVWALGLIAYELLTGECPFRAGSLLEVAARVLQEEPPDLQEVRPDVPAHVSTAIMRCLRKRREDRWGSVEEFASTLEQFVVPAPTPRSSLRSMTNEVSVVLPVAAETLITASSPWARMVPREETTTITFSQTGKLAAMIQARNAQWAMIAMVAFIGLGFVGIVSLWFVESEASPEAPIVILEAAPNATHLVPPSAASAETVWPDSPHELSPVPNVAVVQTKAPVTKAAPTNTVDKNRSVLSGNLLTRPLKYNDNRKHRTSGLFF